MAPLWNSRSVERWAVETWGSEGLDQSPQARERQNRCWNSFCCCCSKAPAVLSPSVCLAESGEPGFVAEFPQWGWACANEFAPSDGKFSWLLRDGVCWEAVWAALMDAWLVSVDDHRTGDNSSVVDAHLRTLECRARSGSQANTVFAFSLFLSFLCTFDVPHLCVCGQLLGEPKECSGYQSVCPGDVCSPLNSQSRWVTI